MKKIIEVISFGLFFVIGSMAQQPANVILIVVDDLGYADLSCTGVAKDVHTPNIDQLSSHGVRFSNCYATAPICNASRISLATGCYQQRQGVYWYSGKGLSNPAYRTIAEVLKDAGYTTGYVGKFHHGSTDKPDGRGFPLNHGFDFFYGFSGGTKHYLHHSRKYQKGKDMLHQGPMWVQREQMDVEGFSTELFGKEARKFISNNQKRKFFLQLSFNAVHNFAHQLPQNYLYEKGLKGFEDQKKGEDYWAWRKKIGYPAHPEGRDYYLGQLYFLDREIGLLVEHLKEHGLEENTAVFFISDNGGSLVTYANNGELNGGKYTLFEGGTRVQMMVSYPTQFKHGIINNSMVSSMDIFPTICSIAGVPKPQNLDGIDITPLLKGEKAKLHRAPLFWDTKHEKAMRKGKWKLLVTTKAPNSRLQITPTPKGCFLFNLEEDTGETKNLASLYPEMVDKLSHELKNWQSECR